VSKVDGMAGAARSGAGADSHWIGHFADGAGV